jgi:outer membrane protein assembly factor BamE (lipoprotein component of BamABCDE complex)
MNTLLKCLLLSVAALLAACASFSGVQPGQSAAEVEKLLGAPTEKRNAAGGDQTWEYNLLPEGRKIWMVTFGADSRVKLIKQSLTEENFGNIRQGQSSRDEVLRLLGKPSSRNLFNRTGEEVWVYQFYSDSWRMLLDVHFGAADGVVRRYTTMLDRGHHYSPGGEGN